MSVVHYYTVKKFQRWTDPPQETMAKIICTGEYIPHVRTDFYCPTTALKQVTCPVCLNILIPRHQNVLDEMKRKLSP